MLTWALVAWAGSLEKIPEVLAEAAYGILVAVMLLMGRLVARETGRTGLGLAAMAAVGTTSVIAPSACWYSAGQTLWAGFGILAALWYAQCWRRSRSFAALVLSAVSAMLAGWFWTIGHIAGPAAALYLWLDGRPKWRWGALAPLAGSVLAVALGMFLGGGKIDSTVSFHGRTTSEAARPVEGFLHTAQAIPENLVLGNLGLKTKTTQSQGLTLTLVLAGIWFVQRFRQGGLRAFNPLECTGAVVVLGSYLVEWTVRGYFPFRLLRTINMGMIVPWYDTVPQIGAVLFVAGWLAGPRGRESKPALLATDQAAEPAGCDRNLRALARLDRAQSAAGRRSLARQRAGARSLRGEARDVSDRAPAVDEGDNAAVRSGTVATAASPAARPGAGRRQQAGHRARRRAQRVRPS